MTKKIFLPGFRISKLDVVILVLGTITAIAVARVEVWIGLVIAFVVGHFFLFCNVLRMARPLELIWAAIFAGLAIGATAVGFASWPAVFGVSAILTILLAIVQMRSASYHGVGWRTLNPQLPEWWNANSSNEGESSGANSK